MITLIFTATYGPGLPCMYQGDTLQECIDLFNHCSNNGAINGFEETFSEAEENFLVFNDLFEYKQIKKDFSIVD